MVHPSFFHHRAQGGHIPCPQIMFWVNPISLSLFLKWGLFRLAVTSLFSDPSLKCWNVLKYCNPPPLILSFYLFVNHSEGLFFKQSSSAYVLWNKINNQTELNFVPVWLEACQGVCAHGSCSCSSFTGLLHFIIDKILGVPALCEFCGCYPVVPKLLHLVAQTTLAFLHSHSWNRSLAIFSYISYWQISNKS